MSHRDTQSWLTSPPMLTRQQCLFLCDIFFRRMCMRICYVHFCCQPTLQLQNYSSLWMITYQENWIGHFVSVYAWMEQLPWLDGFLVSQLGSKRSFLKCKSTHCIIRREMLASWKMSPELNSVLQDVIKIINHIKVYALKLTSVHAALWGGGCRVHTSSLIHRSEMAF